LFLTATLRTDATCHPEARASRFRSGSNIDAAEPEMPYALALIPSSFGRTWFCHKGKCSGFQESLIAAGGVRSQSGIYTLSA
jgi:hypothetical protein